jgi:hypothetical protein
MRSLNACASIISRHRPVLIQEYSFKYWIGKGRGAEVLLPFFFMQGIIFFGKMTWGNARMGCFVNGAGAKLLAPPPGRLAGTLLLQASGQLLQRLPFLCFLQHFFFFLG